MGMQESMLPTASTVEMETGGGTRLGSVFGLSAGATTTGLQLAAPATGVASSGGIGLGQPPLGSFARMAPPPGAGSRGAAANPNLSRHFAGGSVFGAPIGRASAGTAASGYSTGFGSGGLASQGNRLGASVPGGGAPVGGAGILSSHQFSGAALPARAGDELFAEFPAVQENFTKTAADEAAFAAADFELGRVPTVPP